MKLLLQGLSLPSRRVSSASPLPAAQIRSTSSPPPPQRPHIIKDVDDTVGQARVRGIPPHTLVVSPPAPITSSTTTTSTSATATAVMQVAPSVSLSRTTQWRQRKRASTFTVATTASATATTSAIATNSARAPARKEYCCRICSKPMSSTDHSQYRGQRYCPSLYPDTSKEEWLAQCRAKAKAKATPTPN